MPHQIRQGDVYLVPVTSIPENATVRPRDNGRVILAYGEVTGHAHALTAEGVALMEVEGGLEFLKVDAVSALVHEEHGTINIEPGLYQIKHQREYTPEAIRNVAD